MLGSAGSEVSEGWEVLEVSEGWVGSLEGLVEASAVVLELDLEPGSARGSRLVFWDQLDLGSSAGGGSEDDTVPAWPLRVWELVWVVWRLVA